MKTLMHPKTALILFLTAAVAVFSCTRELEESHLPEFQSERLTELLPMQPGKYITYRLDSIVPVFQGRALETRRYQVKDVWDSLLTDNLGQPYWRVFRYITDSLASRPWAPQTTYTITPYKDRVEFTENNLRTVSLQLPLRVDASWKGNKYLPDGAYGSFNILSFSDVNTWDFTYTGKTTVTIGSQFIDNVWTVVHFNQVTDTLAVSNPQNRLYGIGYSADQYAPGIGLVARQLLLIENNPNQVDANTYNPYKSGFGIKMWMIDHN